METDTYTPSFGRYLKAVRIKKGIALKTVAEETRIGLNTLILIENEDIAKLPTEVFTKGFLRAYARAVGADGDMAVNYYVADLHAFEEAGKYEADLHKSGARFWSRLLLATVMMGGIIFGSVYLLVGPGDILSFFQNNTPESHREAGGTPEAKHTVDTESTPPPEPISDKLLLKVAAVKVTWMKVIIDGQNSDEYRLNPGDHLELEAASGFNILVGDAKGIELILNEKPYPIPGKRGQVVTIQIP